jgi:hypothetical protein
MKTFINISLLAVLPVLVFITGCDLLIDEDSDLCEDSKRTTPYNQKVQLKIQAYRNQEYPNFYYNLLDASIMEAYVTMRMIDCKEYEADFAQINYVMYPREEVPSNVHFYYKNIGPVEEFYTTNKNDHLSIKYNFYTAFPDGKIFISDTMTFDQWDWTSYVVTDTFWIYLYIPYSWHEFK